jgi:protein TonB
MSTLELSSASIMGLQRSYGQKIENSALRERLGIVTLVLLLHGSFGLAWIIRPDEQPAVVHEMSVSISVQQPEVSQPQVPSPPKPQPKIEKVEIPKPIVQEMAEDAPQPIPVPVTVTAPTPIAAPPMPVAPAVVNTEPDYKADYLNNPHPAYPMVARRMGYHGKVILNVEVLAEGKAGQVMVRTSSGYDILDNAALQTVKGWKFIPARRSGQPVTQWFLVPIKFSLEDSEA